jgi:rhomboid family GlyGly-CTERM serine protease
MIFFRIGNKDLQDQISPMIIAEWRRWLWPFLVTCAVFLLAAAGDAAHALLRYERAAIEDGQWYRLLTGHWLHLGWVHAAKNAAAFWLLAALDHDAPSLRIQALRLLFLSLAVAAGLYLLQPALQWYVGLSGVLHGLFVIVLLRLVWLRRDLFALALMALLVGKLGWEHYHGALAPGAMGVPVIVAAHSYGAAAGLAYTATAAVARRFATRDPGMKSGQ